MTMTVMLHIAQRRHASGRDQGHEIRPQVRARRPAHRHPESPARRPAHHHPESPAHRPAHHHPESPARRPAHHHPELDLSKSPCPILHLLLR